MGQHQERYEIDGVTYESLDDVPQQYRDSIASLMADRDGNGVPDVFDRPAESLTVVHHTDSYEVDGVTYSSIDEIPEPQRSMVREALGQSAAVSPQKPSTVPADRAAMSRTSTVPAGRTASPPSPIVTPAGWSKRTKLVAGIVAVDVAVAVVVLWLVLR